MTKAIDPRDFLSQLEQLRIWRRGGERAPHKPLVLLYALARIEHRKQRLIPFREAVGPLERLLEEFGPPRRTHHPEFPFWRLERDGIWQVAWPPPLRVSEPRTVDPSRSQLLKEGVEAGFTPEVHALLESDARLRRQAVELLLEQNFPSSLHDEILTAVGIDPEWEKAERRVRDPAFRQKILIAWEYRCGVCRFDLRLGTIPLALDAAHIRWKQVGGPDEESNGIALCAMHHRLFDRGAFTLAPGPVPPDDQSIHVVVSQRAVGGSALQDWLLSFHGRPLEGPQDPGQRPAEKHLKWHRREVFRGPERRF
jgi:putative restriction endonuclease